MDQPVSPLSDEELLKSVIKASHLNTLALEANRNLELSPWQQEELKTGQKQLVIVLLVCAAAIVPALFIRSTITYTLAIFGLIFGAFFGNVYWKLRSAPGRVAIIDGQLTREKKVNYTRYGRSVYYYYHVDDMKFTVDESTFLALSREIPVRAYYMVGTGTLLNLDPLPSGAEKKDPGRLPYTDF